MALAVLAFRIGLYRSRSLCNSRIHRPQAWRSFILAVHVDDGRQVSSLDVPVGDVGRRPRGSLPVALDATWLQIRRMKR